MTDNTALNTGSGGDVIRDIDRSGVKTQVVQLDAGGASAESLISKTNPLPTWTRNDSGVFVQYYATAVAAGTTTTETAITLSKSPSPGGTVTTAASNTVPSGKRFKITSITFASRGHATATAQVTTFSLRCNTAGATTTSSAIMMAVRTSTPATALAWDRFSVSLPDMGIEILGDGTLTFGVTANAVFTTNAPTWDVTITGVEY